MSAGVAMNIGGQVGGIQVACTVLCQRHPLNPTLSGLSLDSLISNLADHCPTAENVLNSIAPSQLSPR